MSILRGVPHQTIVLLVLAVAWSGVSQADPYPAPVASPVTEGNYSVTYIPDCMNGSPPPGVTCVFTNLQEKVEPSGSWTNVSSGTGYISFVSKPPGTYSYRVHVGGHHPQIGLMEVYSSEISVVVAVTPVRDDILTQLDYQYEVRQGDINSNGKTDFYIRKVTGGDPLNGVIEEVILQQASSGATFSAVVPTSGQSAVASGWPISSVDLVLEDINVNGYADVVLTNVSSVVSGASNQIVYAPAQLLASQPLGVRAVDASLKQFVENSLDYFVNPDYFIENVPIYYFQLWIWYAYCDPFGFPGIEAPYWDYFSGCYLDYVYLSGYYADFSVFSLEAVSIFANSWLVEDGVIDPEDALDSVGDAIESLLDVPVGGWPMEEELGSSGELTNLVVRRGLELVWVLTALSRANASEIEPDEAPDQGPRAPDTVYVTGRFVIDDWAWTTHLAVEYNQTATPVWSSLSAQMSALGWLEKREDLMAERRNFTVGIVESSSSPPSVYYMEMKGAMSNYDDDRCYALSVASIVLGCRNSNGFIHGLVNATGGNTAVDFSNYYLGQHPVPSSDFQ